jgi:hypothetical protein
LIDDPIKDGEDKITLCHGTILTGEIIDERGRP